jgi:hypothetical protein
MDVIAGRVPRPTDEGDDLSALHVISSLDEILPIVPVERLEIGTVVDEDDVAVASARAAHHDRAVRRRMNRSAGKGTQVESRVEPRGSGRWMGAKTIGRAEDGCSLDRQGPDELAEQRCQLPVYG